MSKNTDIKPEHEDPELNELISRVKRLSLSSAIVLPSLLPILLQCLHKQYRSPVSCGRW